ncbi:MAG: helix-turn-helix domain-containing protein [Cyclobacteriaceae bacterium]|nr:helix-turn-helix domain-containing protein [Cyclobacteriaceae bacterium SS2]
MQSFQDQRIGAYFVMSTDHVTDFPFINKVPGLMSILWNQSQENINISLDGIGINLEPNQLITATHLQNLKILTKDLPLTSFTFNREFYCIIDHDDEVSCNGILFYGYHEIPLVTIPSNEEPKFNTLLQVFDDEFQNRDDIQGEMLQILLKRLIIKITRLAKTQLFGAKSNESEVELVRQFNILVDRHFKTHKKVSDYADMLFKSPKTLANTFFKFHHSTPLQVIHNRIVLEAKRKLIYTDYSVKEIAFQLGYNDVGSFHKLFKKVTQRSPQSFKKQDEVEIGKNDQSNGKNSLLPIIGSGVN